MKSRSERYYGPRNRYAFARGAHHRELIRQALLAHALAHPLSLPLTAVQIRDATGIRLSDRRVQQIAASIRIETEIRELIEGQLSVPSAPVTDPCAAIDNG